MNELIDTIAREAGVEPEVAERVLAVDRELLAEAIGMERGGTVYRKDGFTPCWTFPIIGKG